jgi:hypothetical protein
MEDVRTSFQRVLGLVLRIEDAEAEWGDVIAAIRSLGGGTLRIPADAGRHAILQHLQDAELAAGNRDVARVAHHLRVAARHVA